MITQDSLDDSFMPARMAEQYQGSKDKLRPVGQIGEFPLVGYRRGSLDIFYLIDNGQAIAMVILKDAPHWIRQRARSENVLYILPAYRGKGIVKAIFRFFLDRGMTLVSDARQTPATKHLWRSLLGQYKLFLVNRRGDLLPVRSDAQFEAAYDPAWGYPSLLVRK